jgi:hypothetical protein
VREAVTHCRTLMRRESDSLVRGTGLVQQAEDRLNDSLRLLLESEQRLRDRMFVAGRLCPETVRA